MPSNKTQDQKLSDRANELYWRSGRSVNQIVEEMDLSKSRLYGLVQPLPSGSPCPQCHAELLFANRTAKEKGFVSCPECDFEGSGSGDAVAKAGATNPATNGQAAVQAGRVAKPRRAAKPARAAQPASATSEPGADKTPASAGRLLRSKRVLWGSMLLAVAAGLYVAVRQRRS